MKEIDKTHVSKPHDRFFREVFSQEDNVRQLLLATLPPRIVHLLDLETINVENTSMIDAKLEEEQSDLLIRTIMRGFPTLIYVLVEHKSYPDRWSVLQLLRYMVRIWERERIKNEKVLPIIIPVLFYHGMKKWRMPVDFSAYFTPPEELTPHIPSFRPVMIDLQATEDEYFRGNEMIQAVLKTMKYIRGNLRNYLAEILRGVLTVPMDEKHRSFLRTLLGYIINGSENVDEQDVVQVVGSVGSSEVREEYMTVAEQLIARGKREGILEGKKESLLKQLGQKFGDVSDKDERRIRETDDPDKLDQALGLILTAGSIAEILRPLG